MIFDLIDCEQRVESLTLVRKSKYFSLMGFLFFLRKSFTIMQLLSTTKNFSKIKRMDMFCAILNIVNFKSIRKNLKKNFKIFFNYFIFKRILAEPVHPILQRCKNYILNLAKYDFKIPSILKNQLC